MSIFHLAPKFFDEPFMLADWEIKDLRRSCERIFDENTLTDYKEYLGNALEECVISDHAPFEEGDVRQEAFSYNFMIMKALDIVKHIADGVEVPAVQTADEEQDERYSDIEAMGYKELQRAFEHFNDRSAFFSQKSASMMQQATLVLQKIIGRDRLQTETGG